jgi:phage-related protein
MGREQREGLKVAVTDKLLIEIESKISASWKSDIKTVVDQINNLEKSMDSSEKTMNSWTDNAVKNTDEQKSAYQSMVKDIEKDLAYLKTTAVLSIDTENLTKSYDVYSKAVGSLTNDYKILNDEISKSIEKANKPISLPVIKQEVSSGATDKQQDIGKTANESMQVMVKDSESYLGKLQNLYNSVFDSISKKIDRYVQTIKNASEAQIGFMMALEQAGFALAVAATGIVGKYAYDFIKAFKPIADVIGVVFKAGTGFAGFASKSLPTSIITVTTALGILSPAFILLGQYFVDTETAAGKFAGTILKVAGVISGGLGVAVRLAIFAIGDLLISIGEKFLTDMEKANKAFQDFEYSMKTFTKVVGGYVKEFGEKATGGFKQWNDILDETVMNTEFSRNEIANSIKSIIAGAHNLGLGFQQSLKLFGAAQDLAAVGNKDLEGTTKELIKALSDSSVLVTQNGINLTNTTLAQTDYAKSIGLSIEQLDENQISMAKYEALMKQVTPILGAASDQTDTIAGANAVYEKTLERINIKIGEQGDATRKYLALSIKFATWWADLPDIILVTIGKLKDFVGVTFIVIGQLLKFTVGALALAGVIQLLNTYVLSLFGTSVALSSIILVITKRIVPWAAAFFVVSKAIEQLAVAVPEINMVFEDLADNFRSSAVAAEETGNNLKQSAGVIERIFTTAVKFASIEILRLAQGLVALSIIYAEFKKLFADDEDILAFDLLIEDQTKKFYALGKSIDDYSNQLDNAMGFLAGASTATKDFGTNQVDVLKVTGEFRKKVRGLADEINSEFSEAAEKQKLFANEFEKASKKIEDSKANLAKVFDLKASPKETAEKLAGAEKEAATARIEAEKLRFDTVSKIETDVFALKLNELRQSGRIVEAVKLETAAKVKQIEQVSAGLLKINGFRSDEQMLIQKQIDSVNKEKEIKIQEEVIQRLEETKTLRRKIADVQKEFTVNVQSDILQEYERVQLRNSELDDQEKLLKLQGHLSQANKDLIAQGRELVDLGSKAKIYKIMTDQAKDLKKENEDIFTNLKIAEALTLDGIKLQLDRQLKIVDALQKELEIKQLLTKIGPPTKEQENIIKQLNERRKLAKEEAAQAAKKAPPKAFEAGTKMGEEVGRSITQAVQGAGEIAGMSAMGAMAGVGAVADAVQALIDFIPGLLEKIANIFNSLTDLPNRIAAGIANLFNGVINFIKNFIPNVIKMVSSIIDSVIKFVAEIPLALVDLLDKIPDLLIKLIEKLPDIIPALIAGLIEGIPKLIDKIIEFTIKDLPKIGIALGMLLVNVMKNLLSGKGFKVPIDTKALGLGLRDFGKKLTGEASKLFAVMDLEGAMKVGAKAMNNVGGGLKDGKSTLDKLFKDLTNGLIAAWRFIYDTFIKPLIDGLTAVWRFVYDTFLKPILDGITAVWRWVWDNIFMPIVNVLKTVWNSMLGALTAVWGVIEAIWSAMINVLSSVWDVLMVVFSAAWGAVQAIWDGMMGIFESAWKMVKNIWDTLMELFTGKINIFEAVFKIGGAILQHVTEVFGEVFKTAQTIFEGVVGIFQAAFKAIGDALGGVADIFGSVFKAGETILKGVADIFQSIFKALQDLVSIYLEIGGKIFEGLKTALTGLWDFFMGLGGAIWEGLKKGLSGLGKLVGDALDAINPANLFGKMFNTDSAKGQGDVEKKLGIDIPFLNFAKGGLIPGQASVPGDSKMNDRIVALLSAGEAVIPRSKMNDPTIAALVQAILDGDIKPSGYAYGAKDLGKDLRGARDTLGNQAENLDPSQLLAKLWDQMKGTVYGKVLDMFWKMLEANKFHEGGLVGGSGDVPTMLKGGEFVINKSAAASLGMNNLSSLNKGQAPANNTQNIEIKLTINSTQQIDETFIKNKLMPTIKDQLRRSSADGQTIVYANGVRNL